MRRPEIDELISLYLDQELSEADEKRLRKAILRDAECRRRFEDACRFRFAEKVAFRPGDRKIIARDLAVQRARMLDPRSCRAAARAGRGRYEKPATFPFSSLAALAAALVALVALGHSFFGAGTLQEKATSSEGITLVDSSISHPDPIIASILQSRNRPLHEGEDSIATALHLSGLTRPQPSQLVLADLAQSLDREAEEGLFREQEGAKRRLVLVVPRDALPVRTLDAQPTRVSVTPGANLNRRSVPQNTVLTTYDPSF